MADGDVEIPKVGKLPKKVVIPLAVGIVAFIGWRFWQARQGGTDDETGTIEDGDFVLWESNSICRYLAMKYGGEALYPKDPATRASIDRWLDWVTSTLIVVETPVFSGTIRTPVEKQDKAAIAANVKKLAEVLQIPENHLAGRQWLAGNSASLADLVLGNFVYRYL